MAEQRKCFEPESYQFVIRQLINRTVKEEKLKIAERLLEKTDLSISQIAEIVDLKKEDLEKAFRYTKRDKSKVKYSLQSATTEEEQLFNSLNRNLLAMEQKNDKLDSSQKE